MASHTYVTAFLVALGLSLAHCQRPSYAGFRPIGYPELGNRYQDPDNVPAYENVFDGSQLGNRFGDYYTTQRIPVDALGDRYLVEMISRWPQDQQPFWFINAQQIEQHRNGYPVYEPQNQQRPQGSGFLSG